MASEVKIYKIKDFIRLNEQGQLDYDRSLRLVHELAATASFHTGQNILIDLRDTTISSVSLNDIFELTTEIGRFKSLFKNKIATVIPDDEERIFIARQFKSCMTIKGFQYDFFTNYENAIEWLSEVTQLKSKDASPQKDI